MKNKFNYENAEMVCVLKLNIELTEREREILKLAYEVGVGDGEEYAVNKFEESGWG